MICSNCGERGHNKTNVKCPRNLIIQYLPNLHIFTQGRLYYITSLNYITKIYPEVLCISPSNIRWTGNFNILKEDLSKAILKLNKCPYPFIFYNLHVSKGGISHANSIIINTKNGRFSRYEPHGSYESWGDLDVNLSKIAQINNVFYDPPTIFCPITGIQTKMNDNIGFCQTSVLYNLLSKLDKNYNYIRATSSSINSRNEIISLMVSLILNIYKKLPEELKSLLLGYNSLNIFQRKLLDEAIINTQTQN